MRELNRQGVTSVIDAGGGFQNYPDDYAVIKKLHADNQLTVRLDYNLSTQKPKDELLIDGAGDRRDPIVRIAPTLSPRRSTSRVS